MNPFKDYYFRIAICNHFYEVPKKMNIISKKIRYLKKIKPQLTKNR